MKKQKNNKTVSEPVYEFKDEIIKIFKMIPSSYGENPTTRVVCFRFNEVSNPETAFEDVYKLSELLGTMKIDFKGYSEEYNLSEVTSVKDYYKEFTCRDVLFPSKIDGMLFSL